MGSQTDPRWPRELPCRWASLAVQRAPHGSCDHGQPGACVAACVPTSLCPRCSGLLQVESNIGTSSTDATCSSWRLGVLLCVLILVPVLLLICYMGMKARKSRGEQWLRSQHSHPRYRPWLYPSHSGGGARAVWEGRTSWSVGPPQCPLTAAELPSAFRGQRSKGRAEVSWEGTGSPSGDIIHPFIHSLVQCPPYSGLFVWAKTQLVTRIQLYRPTTSGLGEPKKAQGGASPEQRHAKGRGQQGPRGAVSTAVLYPHLVPQAAGRSQGPRL